MKRILVIGDAMIDRYWHGDVTRISPEAPVPVVAVGRTEDRMGAAANVVRNIDAMGGSVVGLYSESFHEDPIIKLRIVGRGQQIARVDFDTPQKPIDVDEYKALLKESHIVVVSDYGKGALAKIDELVRLACESGAMVLVDPKGYRYAKYRGAAMVKPNLDEMKTLVGEWESEAELEHKVNVMRNNAEIGAILLTRAAAGMTLYNGHTQHFQAITEKPVDVSGAGEAAISAFAVAVAEGLGFGAAAQLANKAAGLTVQRFGTTVLERSEVWG